jgi:tetratricopeptide (TPR) repeat protein
MAHQTASLESTRPEIEALSYEQSHALTQLVVINEPLSADELAAYLALCGLELPVALGAGLIATACDHGILFSPTTDDTPRLYALTPVARAELNRGLTPGQMRQMHVQAELFYRRQFLALANTLWGGEEGTVPAGAPEEDIAGYLRGLVDAVAHYPQVVELHRWALVKAVYWQEQLFALGQERQAAEITDSICFALARNGQRDLALDLLTRNAAVLEGRRRGGAIHNLATLLREDQQHEMALPLYRRAALLLLRERDYKNVAGVLSEMSNVYRDRGRLPAALLLQHLASTLRRLLRDAKGKAICGNQLSILYRSLRLYPLALWQSRAAESYFRSVADEVNLAKVLLTQGNLYNFMRRPRAALSRFEEGLTISRRMSDMTVVAGATSGQARAHIQLGDFASAQALLEEAITLRQQTDDHLIGVEYENMGRLYEARGERALANQWYHKALPYLEKYLPQAAPGCRRSIERTKRRRRR